VAVVAVAVLVAIVVWWRSGSGSRSPALPQVPPGSVGTVPAPASAAPDAGGQELEALLAKGRKLTFHAVYKASGDSATTGDLTVEVWRKDGNIRQDSRTTTGDGESNTAGFVVDGKATTCSKVGSDPWSCSSAPDPGTDLDGIFGSAAAQVSGLAVTAADDTVAGHKTRCFSFTQADGEGRVCVSPEGLPLQLKINDIDLTIQSDDANVESGVFVPPATPGT
jgi:hypothetical protein